MFKKFNAYLTGYYGMNNTGDDVLLYTSRWAIRHILGYQRDLVSSASNISCPEFGDISAYPTAKFRGHHRLVHYKNALLSENIIFGGGSVLHSEKDIQFKRHLLALTNAKSSRCVGVGIEPFESINAEKACAKFLSECGFVGVRDANSLEIATAIAPQANVKLTFDLAPLLLCHQSNRLVAIERKGVMFNFCQQAIDAFGHTNVDNERRHIKMAIETIKKTWQNTNEDIYLLDFNGHAVFGDFHLHQQIIAGLPDHIPVVHIPYDPNPFRVLQRMARFKVTVSMRLHSAILSYLANTPAISIIYHEKCKRWCQQVGVPEQYQFDAGDLCPKILTDTLTKGLGIGFTLPTMNTDEAIKATLLNWR
ncbi:polysaccharide pyruvyl transferase family protein [Psychromonas sp. MB-3u-54]|uniref:polysaccharide pyruvyl transferase family protein n=1 Tax=Psychromonas sp. MB-3u-54 TaxID=2058319 RepID=UPI000C32D59B|nr:polysaccharide pyruvyl transferase family protein [Psychromonas sp. MB-3u-54]PKH03003.1 polysaccharide pyruvyl transferase family protein [Psychromonas sp. MB-3u-54]